MQEKRLQELLTIARMARSNSEGNKIRMLNLKLIRIQKQIYNDQVKKRQLFTITPNIIIQKLSTYDSLKNCCYLEYHVGNKSLFFNEIKNGHLERIQIRYALPKSASEFYKYTKNL